MFGGRATVKFLMWSSSILSKSDILFPGHGGELFFSLNRASSFKSTSSCLARVSSRSISNDSVKKKKKNSNRKEKSFISVDSLVKRTRSNKELDEDIIEQHLSADSHVPVMLGEVLDVFSNRQLRSFVDCTVGAGGHSSAIIQAHPELQCYIGLDMDPVAHEMARTRINGLLNSGASHVSSDLRTHFHLKNFKFIRSVLSEVDEKLIDGGVDGILMDLGMSSMQVNNPERGFSVLGDGPLDMRMNPQESLTAEHILNSWPVTEIGRILREYGEESNWFSLQNKIDRSRNTGGLHSTRELVKLIQNSTPRSRGGRQGWIKTATRVFQALRIAVNDELKTLEDSVYNCFDCLSPGGRLAVISFHSLEDRIVKQTFLDIIGGRSGSDEGYGQSSEPVSGSHLQKKHTADAEEAWIKRVVQGNNARILTKRPITPSEKEEELNRRSRSAKLRVIEKV
ncbi:uncharacterized protein LOC116196745 [Punica granatum]|uniref:Uncharacterized protein LOC116196745 n=2 Tax=Punica granatum TaxID=22663 RepID=A0A218W734_PUNGR|nr:uncharacterized protein LOC116196745 [Punica granatum]XP_031382480.1 uncharacterized protein LOC116196745 [Punica granatum]OWM67902.1 hypothetical protein CDL15_Pgr010840 [Punica granatum]